MGDELWCGQTQNEVNLEFDLKFDLEDQGWSLHKTIETLSKLFCTFGPNLVMLAWTGPELSHGQASDWHRLTHTHRHTDTGNDNTRKPKLASGKNFIREDQEVIHPLLKSLISHINSTLYLRLKSQEISNSATW